MRCRKFRSLPAVALLLASVGCAGTDLGGIDESRHERDDMAGPGVFADRNGATPLQWTLGEEQPAADPAAPAPAVDEQAEFELYKQWRRLKAEGADSPEYREFLQWLEFREFKAAQ
jgi:hypothetical protein